MGLNERAHEIATDLVLHAAEIAAACHDRGGVRVLDCGVARPGSPEAGLAMARVALGGLGSVTVATGGPDAAWSGCPWPTARVATDRPVAACLASQYAGWRIATPGYFAMASGPVRAAIGHEAIFDTIGRRERPRVAVGVLEASRLPPEAVCLQLAADAGVSPARLILLVARTASIAGTLQVVARSLETALHQLHVQGFDLERIRAGHGSAPVPPVPGDDLTAIGRTNDAILYGGRVVLEVSGDDANLAPVGPRAVSRASPAFGRPFLEIFTAAGGDFYAIDPALFAPAQLELTNVETGRVHRFGELEPGIVARSFAAEAPARSER